MTLHEAIELHRERLTGEQCKKLNHLTYLSYLLFVDAGEENKEDFKYQENKNDEEIKNIIELLNHPDDRSEEIADLINTEITQAIKDSEELLNN
jgi:hypothetical protein